MSFTSFLKNYQLKKYDKKKDKQVINAFEED